MDINLYNENKLTNYSLCVLTMYCLKSIHCCTGIGCTEASTSRLALKFSGCSTQSAHADPAKHEPRTLLPYTHATHPCYHRRPWRWRKRLAHESQEHHAASVRCSTSARHARTRNAVVEQLCLATINHSTRKRDQATRKRDLLTVVCTLPNAAAGCAERHVEGSV